jgi:hypothetical protein
MQAFQLIMSRQLDDKARVTVWASVWLSYVQPLVAHGENCALQSGKSLTPFRIMAFSYHGGQHCHCREKEGIGSSISETWCC